MKGSAIRVAVDVNKAYYWCNCGLSKGQIFYDSSLRKIE